MRTAVIGLGAMGTALAQRLLETGHEVSVWNRTPGRAGPLVEVGARELSSPDAAAEVAEAVLLCLADDASVLAVAAPDGAARPGWGGVVVASTATVAPATTATLAGCYGDRFVAAPILGAPQAVRSGEAAFVIAGSASARAALAPVWQEFRGPQDVGDDPARASVVKLLNNALLLASVAVVAETVRAGRAAGVDDAALTALLRESPMVPAGLQNRVQGLFDPQHRGWFTPPLAAKDLDHALGLVPAGIPLPVVRAARDAYRQVAADGWGAADVTALVELGRTPEPS